MNSLPTIDDPEYWLAEASLWRGKAAYATDALERKQLLEIVRCYEMLVARAIERRKEHAEGPATRDQ
jgi:hypothetical protein